MHIKSLQRARFNSTGNSHTEQLSYTVVMQWPNRLCDDDDERSWHIVYCCCCCSNTVNM